MRQGVGKASNQLVCSEADLVRACLAGDNSSYDELVRRHQKLLYNFCYRMLGNGEDAGDAVQEAFVRAYRALGRFRQGSPFGPWLYRIAHNVCIDKQRARSRAACASLEEQGENGWEPMDEGASPHDQAENGELGDTLQEAISELPPKYRSVIVMKHFQQMDIKEISATLRIPEGTVKANLHRARHLLRRKLAYLEAIV